MREGVFQELSFFQQLSPDFVVRCAFGKISDLKNELGIVRTENLQFAGYLPVITLDETLLRRKQTVKNKEKERFMGSIYPIHPSKH